MTKPFITSRIKAYLFAGCLLCALLHASIVLHAQVCPPSVPVTIFSYPNTYYPGQQATVAAGSNSVVIGAATYGSTPIGTGDILLIIQMQGAQINATNTSLYGDGASGSGYLNNSQLLAGNMEYVVATNAVPLTGGTLALQSALVNSYRNTPFGADGQYTYQVIHVPAFYTLILGAAIVPPAWDGATGGVLVLNVVNILDMNGQVIDASGAGFRGGGGVLVTNGLDNNTDMVTMSPSDADLGSWIGDHASKGEGIAGTPRLVNSNNYGFLTRYIAEGYPNGSFAMGAPGNAGGGANDYWPMYQNDNSGGGGGGNGGPGGKGGNSFSSNEPVGGNPGAVFAQNSPSRLVMGGGGGAGDNNNNTGNIPDGFASSGATGGGIVIISTGSIANAGIINVNGMMANGSMNYDGSGGGGGGGSVLIHAGSGHANITVYADGGEGGSNDGAFGANFVAHGPGGGGGGGVVYTDGALNAGSSVNSGAAGFTQDDILGVTNYGAAPGTPGILQIAPVSLLPPLVCFVLPMEFLLAEGVNKDGRVAVNWIVTNEKNMRQYIVEKSSNAIDFSAAGTIAYKPTAGNSNKYSFTDPAAVQEGTVYYRIRAADKDGRYTFSKIITVKTALVPGLLSVSPNPASRAVVVKWAAAGNKNVVICLFNATGQQVLSQQYLVKAGITTLTLSHLETLPNGLYVLRCYEGTTYKNEKLMIRH